MALSEELKLLGFSPLGFSKGEDFLRKISLRNFAPPIRLLIAGTPQDMETETFLQRLPPALRLLACLLDAHIANDVLPLLRLGICAYVLRKDPVNLHSLFLCISENGGYLSPGATGKILNEFRAIPPQKLLSFREIQILREICKGASGISTAQFLGISINTLRWHLKNIYRKLNVKNRVELLSRAQSLGFL